MKVKADFIIVDTHEPYANEIIEIIEKNERMLTCPKCGEQHKHKVWIQHMYKMYKMYDQSLNAFLDRPKYWCPKCSHAFRWDEIIKEKKGD